MKEEHKMTPDKYQALALKTWYSPDDARYLDPRHPLIKLAGEAGELLDLYGKHEYKPGFDWWNCKHCGYGDASHSLDYKRCPVLSKVEDANILRGSYTPLVLDELGDWWYYLRIVTWQQGVSIEEWIKELQTVEDESFNWDIFYCLSQMNQSSANVLMGYINFTSIAVNSYVWNGFVYFARLLPKLNTTLDHLTELNYAKLNSEATAHGWKQVA